MLAQYSWADCEPVYVSSIGTLQQDRRSLLGKSILSTSLGAGASATGMSLGAISFADGGLELPNGVFFASLLGGLSGAGAFEFSATRNFVKWIQAGRHKSHHLKILQWIQESEQGGGSNLSTLMDLLRKKGLLPSNKTSQDVIAAVVLGNSNFEICPQNRPLSQEEFLKFVHQNL